MLAGDLSNQIISSTFTSRGLAIPYLGLFGACSTSMEALALGALIVDTKFGNNVLCGTASHYAAVEKQYRYPTEYGSQNRILPSGQLPEQVPLCWGRQDRDRRWFPPR